MTEHRYDDDEVREIFRLATDRAKLEPPKPRGSEGLTLAEIQDIGREVGLEPDVVARAAVALRARPPRPLRRSWGMPIEVGRMVPLPRPLTDREWDQLVGELRSTFGARGRVAVQGSVREWSNGNLHATVEPAGEGYRLRLGTVKGDAAGVNALGATGIAAGIVTFGSMALSGDPQAAMVLPALLGASGSAAFLANLLRLPRWADQRRRQMEHVAGTALAITGQEPAASS